MNFDQTLSLLDGIASACSALILLVLAAIAYKRTQDWGFFCWLFSSSGYLLETILLHTGPSLRYYGYRLLFFVTVIAFTAGAVRIVYRYLQLSSARHSYQRPRGD